MFDPTPHPLDTDSAAAHREIAVDWLVGRLRWERILRELHDRADGTEPVAPVVEITADATGDAATDGGDQTAQDAA